MSSRQAVKTVTVPVSTTCTMRDVQRDKVFSEKDFVRTRSNLKMATIREWIAVKRTWAYNEDHCNGDDEIADEAASQPYGNTRVELGNLRDVGDEEVLFGSAWDAELHFNQRSLHECRSRWRSIPASMPPGTNQYQSSHDTSTSPTTMTAMEM